MNDLSLDQLMGLLGKKKEAESDLQKVAQTQVTGQPWNAPEDQRSVWDRMTGKGATPEQARALNQYYGAILNRDKRQQTMAGAASQGFEKGSQLMDEIRNKRKMADVEGAKVGADSAGDEFQSTYDLWKSQQSEAKDKRNYGRDVMESDRDFNEDKRRWDLEFGREGSEFEAELAYKYKDMVTNKPADISATTEKEYAASANEFRNAANKAQQSESLAQQLRQLSSTGGAPTAVFEKLKQWSGSEDWQSGVYMQTRGILTEKAIANLPPGVASDRDVAIVMEAVPQRFADPEYLATFLEAHANLQREVAKYNEAKIDFMDNNAERGHSIVGFNQHWKALKVTESPELDAAVSLLAENPTPEMKKFFDEKMGRGMASAVLKIKGVE